MTHAPAGEKLVTGRRLWVTGRVKIYHVGILVLSETLGSLLESVNERAYCSNHLDDVSKETKNLGTLLPVIHFFLENEFFCFTIFL